MSAEGDGKWPEPDQDIQDPRQWQQQPKALWDRDLKERVYRAEHSISSRDSLNYEAEPEVFEDVAAQAIQPNTPNDDLRRDQHKARKNQQLHKKKIREGRKVPDEAVQLDALCLLLGVNGAIHFVVHQYAKFLRKESSIRVNWATGACSFFAFLIGLFLLFHRTWLLGKLRSFAIFATFGLLVASIGIVGNELAELDCVHVASTGLVIVCDAEFTGKYFMLLAFDVMSLYFVFCGLCCDCHGGCFRMSHQDIEKERDKSKQKKAEADNAASDSGGRAPARGGGGTAKATYIDNPPRTRLSPSAPVVTSA